MVCNHMLVTKSNAKTPCIRSGLISIRKCTKKRTKKIPEASFLTFFASGILKKSDCQRALYRFSASCQFTTCQNASMYSGLRFWYFR